MPEEEPDDPRMELVRQLMENVPPPRANVAPPPAKAPAPATARVPTPPATARVPTPPAALAVPARAPKPAAAPSVVTYTVKKGENLWVISEKVLGKGEAWRDIAKENKISLAHPACSGRDDLDDHHTSLELRDPA